MTHFELDEPDYVDPSDHCEAVRIFREGKNQVEVTIFYTPSGGLYVHNGCIVEKKELCSYGRTYHRLKIVTPRGKIIFVRRYEDNEGEEDKGEFVVTSEGYWLKQKDANL